MSFKRNKGGDKGFIRLAISSIAVAVGDTLYFDRTSGTVVLGTSSSLAEDFAGVAVEAKTTADTSVLVQQPEELDEYVADTTNNSNAAHNYQKMILTNASTVNNTGTDSDAAAAIFMQLGTVGTAATKKIRGRFITRRDI